MSSIQAVIFDMDGILIDSEMVWQRSREAVAADLGKVWTEADQHKAMGSSTIEWATLMKNRLEISAPIEDIIADMKKRVLTQYMEHLLILPGALEAVHLAASNYKVALASGSTTQLIQQVMAMTGLDKVFEAIIYGDDFLHGKPAPDIYLEAARRLGVAPAQCVGIEDSSNGIRSLKAAGMVAIAVPGADFPLPAEILQMADRVLPSLESFSLELVESL
ncbi:MAG: HAD family phosphatase [Chloroflexota bacterium]